jgi:curved DNA-binding protein CbpA
VSEALAWARRWARRPGAADHELLEVGSSATEESVRAAYHKLARFAHPDLHRAAVTADELEEITDAFARVSNAYSVLTARLRKEANKAAAKAVEQAEEQDAAAKAVVVKSTEARTERAADEARAARDTRELRDARSGRVTRPASAPPPATPSPSIGRQAVGTSPIAPTGAAPPSGNPPAAAGTGRMPVVQFTSKGATQTTGASVSATVPGVSGRATASARDESTSSGASSTTTAPASDGPAISLSAKGKMHYRRAELCLRRGEIIEAKLHLRLAMASDPQSTFLRKAFDDLDRR